MKKRNSIGFPDKIWNFFISVKLTVAILLTLAATSIVGTVIQQNKGPSFYIRKFGDFYYRLFDTLNIIDMYHSWWYQLLLLLLAVNIIACSIDRLSSTWKIIFIKIPKFNIPGFRKSRNRKEFMDDRPPEQLKQHYERVLSKNFGYHRAEDKDNGFFIFAEKWRWTRLGVYLVHLSIIFLLLGGIIGSIFGFEGFVNIPEGETIDRIRVTNSGKTQKLDFQIHCKDFHVSFYNSGQPKEFRSSLSILEHGKAVLEKDIIVNAPLRYKGVNIFQSSYGKMMPERPASKGLPSDKTPLHFTVKATGMIYHAEASIGVPIDLPEGLGKFVVTDFLHAADFRGQNIGHAYTGILTLKGKEPVRILLPTRFSNFDKMRKGALIISVEKKPPPAPVENQKTRYYTGLQVTHDPGVQIVYTGFVLMIIGCFITFFMPHRQLCIEATQKGETTLVMIAGSSLKNTPGMQTIISGIHKQLIEKRPMPDD